LSEKFGGACQSLQKFIGNRRLGDFSSRLLVGAVRPDTALQMRSEPISGIDVLQG
jgi:hypothetical protein